MLCLDDAPVQDILPRVERRTITYGLSPQAHVSARDLEIGPLGSAYTATWGGEPLGSVALAVPGAHNVVNSLAAVAVGIDLGLGFDAVKAGLESFTGVDRRFQVRGEAGGVLVVDDYGHHPTEIRVTLEALRLRAGGRRTLVLFQPHRFTRTAALWDDFCRAFHQADVLLVTDIYAAGRGAAARGHRRSPGPGHRRARASPRGLRRPARGRGGAARRRSQGGRRRPHPGRGKRVDRRARSSSEARSSDARKAPR